MLWTRDQLAEVLAELRQHRGDTTSIEVKRATGGIPTMPETLCAFANMPNGGTVILGVEEAGGAFNVVGVTNEAQLEAGIVAQAREAVSPSPQLSFQTFEIAQKTVQVAHVSPLRIADRPAYVGGRAYLRQADGDYVMQSHELRMIEVAKLHADEQTTYDLTPAQGHSVDDLSPDLVRDYAQSVRRHDRRLSACSDDDILRLTSVVTAAGTPTLAGLYALGKYPQGLYPALTVTAAVQLPGGEGQARNRNLRDFTGPLPVLLTEVLGWVEQNLDTVRRYRADGHMESVSELPLNAVRELISNALVHRDLGPNTLGLGKQIQVRVTPQSLFIQSPGGLRGVSLAQLVSVEHAQAAVNQRLYQIAKRLVTADGASVIEGEGGGVQEVFRSTQARGLPSPQLVDTGVQFKALLWRPNKAAKVILPATTATEDSRRQEDQHTDAAPGATAPYAATQKQGLPNSSAPTKNEATIIKALASTEHGLSLHEISTVTGLTFGQIRYALTQPVAEGVIVVDGGQGIKTTRYRLAAAPV